jgi:hypothetical protein
VSECHPTSVFFPPSFTHLSSSICICISSPGGVCKSTALCGTVLGMGFVTILREVLSEDEMQRWGWRIPFLASVLLGLLGLYLRSQLHESEEFMKVKNRGSITATAAASAAEAPPSTAGPSCLTCLLSVSLTASLPVISNPLTMDDSSSNLSISSSSVPTVPTGQRQGAFASSALEATSTVVRYHWPEILFVMCVAAYWAAGYYATFIWMAYYTSDLMPGGGMEHHPWVINIAMLIVLVSCLPVGGIIGDLMMARARCVHPSCTSFRPTSITLPPPLPSPSCHSSRDNLLGYRRTMAFACLITIVFAVPAFALINMKQVWSVCLGQGIFAVSLSLYGSLMVVVMVEQVTRTGLSPFLYSSSPPSSFLSVSL